MGEIELAIRNAKKDLNVGLANESAMIDAIASMLALSVEQSAILKSQLASPAIRNMIVKNEEYKMMLRGLEA
jgi:hypothetical protein